MFDNPRPNSADKSVVCRLDANWSRKALWLAALVVIVLTTSRDARAQSYTWGYQAASGSTALGTSPWSVGSGTSDYLLIGVGYNGANGSGIVNASQASSITINVGRFYVGECAFYNPTLPGTQGGAGSGSAGTGTLLLGTNNTITASEIFLGGSEVEANTGVAGGSVGTITTAAGGTTTIATPSMTLANSKGNNGYVTLGSNATLNLGSSGSRTALGIGVLYTFNNNTSRTVSGSMSLEASGAIANLNLSSLHLSYTPVGIAGGTRDGALTLSSNVNNLLNVSGTGTPVQIGVGSGAAGSFTGGSMTGLLRIGNLGSSSLVESTNNATAIMVGAKPSGAGASINGTLDFRAGTLTIKTTGTGIAGGGGNTSSLLLGESGNVTLKAGAASTDFIGGLGTATIRSFGATIDTNGFDVGLSQAFSGTGGLTKSGTGRLTLTGSSSYSGGTTISTGTLQIGNSGTSGAISGNVTNNATLVFNRSNDLTFSGTIGGSGAVVQSGGGALTLSAANTYTGATTISSGTVILSAANAISGSSAITIGSPGSRGYLNIDDAVTISSLTFTGSGGDVVDPSNGTATFSSASGTATITVSSGSNKFHANATLSSPTLVNVSDGAYFSFHNNLAGSSSLTKSGSGTLNLTGDNDTLAGNFFITDGLVTIGPGMNQIGTGTTTLSGGATIDLNGRSFSNQIVVLDGTILNAGGTATTTTIAGISTVGGTTALGTYNITSTGSALFNVAVGDGAAAVDVNVNEGGGSGGQATFAQAIGSNGSVTVWGGGTAAFNSTVAGYVIAHGATTFNGNVLSGEVQVNSGTAGTGSALFAAGVASTVTIQSGASAEFRGAVAGPTTVSGSALFTSASSLTGDLDTTPGGVATLDNLGSEITGSIHADGLVTVNRASGSQTISGVIDGTGSLVKQGAGKLLLTAANTFTGTTTLAAGTLVVNGSLSNAALDVSAGATLMGSGTIGGLTTIAGIHSPGNSPAVQSFANLTYTSTSSVYWELWNNTISNSPVAYDQIVVNGDLAFTGTTVFNLVFTGSAGPSSYSEVDWTNSFWDTSREWLVYNVTGTTTGFSNLFLNTTDWLDSTNATFSSARAGATFSVENRSGDIFVVYAAPVPEPGTLALAGIGLAATAWALRRRRKVTIPGGCPR